MQNHLKNQTSPYLLQHADNPVNWYPWCDEAFERAKKEDKPILLSIGYSTCHWCHVMAHESFEDTEVAEILNKHFIAIKVDKEERPDIDSIYMSVCQELTGSGGWPTTIFMTWEQKPFFAGTYFPKTARYGQVGFLELLSAIQKTWQTDRRDLLESAEKIHSLLKRRSKAAQSKFVGETVGEIPGGGLIDIAFELYKRSFDEEYGGFGNAPKFPTPHNLLFLLQYYEKSGNEQALKMVEKTLMQMYRGGIFDHIGGGFSRYSTDPYYLVPHFEKMLYDNALLILAYCKAYQVTGNQLYCNVAEKTAAYVLRELTSPQGGFYCAQDADSEGVEGKYYLLEPSEVVEILGEEVGKSFNQYFDITEQGNFEGRNIPNILKNTDSSENMNIFLPAVYEFRKNRYALHLDDKILCSWNGLMIAAMCNLYRVTENRAYLEAAIEAMEFIMNDLCENETLYVSYRGGKHSNKGFVDDYASVIFAMLALYEATLDTAYLVKAEQFCDKAIADFYDKEKNGFFLYGEQNEQLILRPKETYDGAIPSGNSLMAYDLVRLYLITGKERYGNYAVCQLHFMSAEARQYPAGYAMYLVALSDYIELSEKVTIVVKEKDQIPENLSCRISLNTVCILERPSEKYKLKNDRITFYVCKGHQCLPPVNMLGRWSE